MPAELTLRGAGLAHALPAPVPPRRAARMVIAAVLLALAVMPGDLGRVTREQVTDAFTAVTAFVAATLLLFYGAERVFGFDTGRAMERARHWQVPIAALLGLTPGCGGAVMVVAAYAAGRVRFGALVATLISTMGDAAFLLIATRPESAAVLLPLQFSAGVLTGWLVDRFVTPPQLPVGASCAPAYPIGRLRLRDLAYLACLAPALALGVSDLAGYEAGAVLGLPVEALALAGTMAGLWLWAASPVSAMTNPGDPPVTRMAEETAFISVWVLVAFLIYAYLEAFAGLDLAAVLDTVAIFLPLIAALIGFIPGCGPQILVATLYLNGAVPFAALVANAISNDGDALFPAIALAPRAAVLATLWSVVPALIVGYGLMALAPGLLD